MRVLCVVLFIYLFIIFEINIAKITGEVNFGLQVRSYLTLLWAYTGSKESLNVSLKAAIDILFIQLW